MAKLSSREQKVRKDKAAQAKLTTKPAARATAAKAPLMGAGPLMPGQSRVANSYGGGSQLQGSGPLLPGQQRVKDSYKGGSSTSDNRRKAAAAANIKNTGFDFQSAVDSGGLTVNQNSLPVSQRPATLGQGGSTFMGNLKNKALGGIMDIFSNVGDYHKQIAGNGTPAEGLQDMSKFAYDNTLGVPGANAANRMDLPASGSQYQADLAAAFGPQAQETNLEDAFSSGGITESVQNGRPSNPFGFPTAQASENPYGGNTREGSFQGNDNGGIDPTLQAEMGMDQYSQDQNEAFGGNDQRPEDIPGATVGNRSGRGSGMFGTGKGLQGDDPYIKELRKAYSSNGGEKWLRKKFDELIKALDPTYAALQKEGTDALNANLMTNQNQLASVMNAGNVGDSEQRTQQLAGLQNQNQIALGQLLAKLAQGKAEDTSQYKQSYAEKRGQLQDRNQSNAQALIEKIRSYQADQQDQAYKQQVLGQKGTKTPAKKNMSLTPISWGADGKPDRWVDQSTGDVFEDQ